MASSFKLDTSIALGDITIRDNSSQAAACIAMLLSAYNPL